MEKSLIYCLSFLLLLTYACQSEEVYYKKEFSQERQLDLAEKLLDGMGFYYQGEVGEQFIAEEMEKFNPEHAELWRERGIPYLKRGIAYGYLPNYEKCINYDSLGWLGYRGYCTLYFYRDYDRALTDFIAADKLTPGFTDYPQATSIDYMKGVCYLGLEEYEKAIEYLDKYITTEGEIVGYEYIYAVAYLLKGVAYKQMGQPQKAQEILEYGIEQHQQNADLEYQLALLLQEQGKNTEALKWVKKAKQSFKAGYYNMRPYIDEFYQVYLIDIEELEAALSAIK